VKLETLNGNFKFLNLDFLRLELKDSFHVEQKENKVNSEDCLKRFAENNKTKCF